MLSGASGAHAAHVAAYATAEGMTVVDTVAL